MLLLSLLPASALAAGGTTHTIPDKDSSTLQTLLTNGTLNDGDTIVLEGVAYLNETTGAPPLIIDKAVTIQGGTLSLRPGGILLGADVTFDGVTLSFTNRVRNAIMANGHTLTLKDVSIDSGVKQPVHLFCGGLTGHKAQVVANTPSGTTGTINLLGTTSLSNSGKPGNIYAGSLSSDGQANSFAGNAVINVQSNPGSSVSRAENQIYACGALETSVPDNWFDTTFVPAPPAADSSKYKMNGTVTVNLHGNLIKAVDGKTGGTKNAHVTYTGGQYKNTSLNVQHAVDFSLKSGQLELNANTNLSDANLSVASGAELSLVNCGKLTTNNFTGGGAVVLGQKQTWSINGTVTGTTTVGIGSIFNGASETVPTLGHTYIHATNSADNSFSLLTHSNQPNHKLVRDTSGNWTVLDGPKQEVKVESASFQTPQALEANNHGTEIPVTVVYEPVPDLGILSEIPMDLTINGYSAQRQGDADSGYSYTTTGNLAQLNFEVYDNYEALSIQGTGQGDELDRIAPGQYTIVCTIPGTHTVSKQPITFSTTLDVVAGSIPDTDTDLSQAKVTVNGTYSYTGQPITPDVTVTANGKTLVKDRDYTVSATNHTNAGTATVTITAAKDSGYTGTQSIPFSISPAPLTLDSAVIAPKTYDGSTSAQVTSLNFTPSGTKLMPDQDYTASARFDTPDAGKDRTVTVTASLQGQAAQNYTLQNNTLQLTGQTIQKGTAAARPGSLSVRHDLQTTYSYDLSQLMPDLPVGQTFGNVTYTVGNVSLGSYYISGAAVQGNTLTLPIQSASGQDGPIGTVSIQIQTDNFAFSDAVIEVSATSKQVPQGHPTLNRSHLTYGEPLSAITLSGHMTTAAGTAVDGQFSWRDPAQLFSAGTHHAEWTFAPDDTALYQTVSGTAEIVVERATPTGRPSYQTSLKAGQTLADAKLSVSGGTFSVPGTVAWKLPADTVITAYTAYQWVFTPKDTNNYTPLTGSVVLCTTDGNTGGGGSGGGSGSGGSGGSSGGNNSSTVTNPDGSTTTTVTRPNGSTTETTKYPDGSTVEVDTAKNGTVTTTTTDADGNKNQTVVNPDGSGKTTVTQTDGTTSITTTSPSGQVSAQVSLPQSVVDNAQKPGAAVSLPVPEMPVSSDRATAPTIQVDTPSSAAVKVKIPVKRVTPGTVAILVKADGTEEILKTSLVTADGVTVRLPSGSTVKLVDNYKPFRDVPGTRWSANAVAFVSSRAIFEGTSTVTFSPSASMTRAMIVTALARFDGVDTASGSTWYEKGAQWAVANGISDGTNLDRTLTREQLVSMLYRYAGTPATESDLSGFADSSTLSPYAEKAMSWAVETGLISGVGSSTLAPRKQATREQVAAVLARFINTQNT